MQGYIQPLLVSVEDLFSRCIFRVPAYQRAYAWERPQWEDLWEDLTESLRNETEHYLGTIVLRETGDYESDPLGRRYQVFDIVDGQQRVTTLVLLVLALHDSFRDEPLGQGLWKDFVKHDGLMRLLPGGTNANYFSTLLAAASDSLAPPDDSRATNRRLGEAVRFYREKLETVVEVGDIQREDIVEFFRGSLRILRFVTNDEALAIKTFQTVNDRGRELTLLDKAKSLVMFYLVKYLPDDSATLSQVQDAFGEVFEQFDRVRDLGREHGVDYVINPRYRFSEEELLRFLYHYFGRHALAHFGLRFEYAYDITARQVFEAFLKGALRQLRTNADDLRAFVREFTADFVVVAKELSDLLGRIPEDGALGHLLCYQELSASVYPLIINVSAAGHLDDAMIDAIAALDMRVYKIRGTDPKAWLYKEAVSRVRTGVSKVQILGIVRTFTEWYGTDGVVERQLDHDVYGQRYIRYILWEEACRKDESLWEHVSTLYKKLQVEHILPREPSFDVTTASFKSNDDYTAHKNRLGNLCLLEKGLNNAADNVPPFAKVDFYAASKLAVTRHLGNLIREKGFAQSDLLHRTSELAKFVCERWPIPPSEDTTIEEVRPPEIEEDSQVM